MLELVVMLLLLPLQQILLRTLPKLTSHLAPPLPPAAAAAAEFPRQHLAWHPQVANRTETLLWQYLPLHQQLEACPSCHLQKQPVIVQPTPAPPVQRLKPTAKLPWHADTAGEGSIIPVLSCSGSNWQP
jgi:hypothetical protein